MLPRRTVLAALCIGVILVAASASAQGFRALYSRDGVEVIAVGDNGELYRSLDRGVSYFEQTVGSASEQLRDLAGRPNLSLVAVGDAGSIWASTDDGGTWAETIASGAPDLRAVAMPSDDVWFVAGAGGTILRSTDAGGSWSPLPTGTSARLNALKFTDSQNGWAAGDDGTLLWTSNGGDTWTPSGVTSVNDLLSVDQQGANVWAVGENGVAFKSTTSGASFVPVDLGIGQQVDVLCVTLVSSDSVWLAGGGGFIRLSPNGGATWTYPVHRMHAPVTDLLKVGSSMWACDASNRLVMRSTNAGFTWQFPSGGTLSMSWALKSAPYSSAVRGSGFALNPVSRTTIYCLVGTTVYRTQDSGESWSTIATIPAAYNRANAFVISPKDTNVWLAAVASASGSPDAVIRTIDAGANWTSVLTHDFGEYGIPLEMDPDHPDTVYFGGEILNGVQRDQLRVSYDFGVSWNEISGPLFRSPCDILAFPGSSNQLLLGDGTTGSGRPVIFKSTNYGATFPDSTKISTGSEIPAFGGSRLKRNQVFATNWASGYVRRSVDYGLTWTNLMSTSEGPWGIGVGKDDPNVVVFGDYTSNLAYVSVDSGATFTTVAGPIGFFSSHSFLIPDRGTIIAEMNQHLCKLVTTYGYTPAAGVQGAITVVAPNGGETWNPNTTHTISWTQTNLTVARLEYRRAGEPWQKIADVPGYANSYAWLVPSLGSTQVKIRVSDAWDGSPADSSNAVFSVPGPYLVEAPGSLDFGTVDLDTSHEQSITIANSGTSTLSITSITTQSGAYVPGRTSLALAPGQQDTVGVWFTPSSPGSYPDTLVITDNDVGHSPLRVQLAGQALAPTDVPADHAGRMAFALDQNHPNPFRGRTTIHFSLARATDVSLEVFDLRGERVATLMRGREPAGDYNVEFARGARGPGGAGTASLPAGLYFCRLVAGDFAASRKMLLVR